MDQQPLVSVLICVYNGERFLQQTIESVLAQTYSNIELIIIDDASTDNSRKIIESYSDKRIKTFYRQENGNICVAGNQAFKMANGKYYAFMGHDDIWVDNKLQEQVEFMEENSSYGVCFTRCHIIDQNNQRIDSADGNLFDQMKNQDRVSMFRELFYENNKLCAPSAMARREIIEETGGFSYSLLQLQDYELWLRVLSITNIYILEKKLTYYRITTDAADNISSNCDNNNNRVIHEDIYLVENMINTMTDEQFKEFFEEDFMYPQAGSMEELSCERAFILLKKENYYYLNSFMRLLDNEDTRKVLSEKYNMTPQDFYKMNGKTVFWEKTVYDKMLRLERLSEQYKQSMEAYKNIAEKQQKILNKMTK